MKGYSPEVVPMQVLSDYQHSPFEKLASTVVVSGDKPTIPNTFTKAVVWEW